MKAWTQAGGAAACHNPVLKPVAKRLKEHGKPHKLVIIAIANAIIFGRVFVLMGSFRLS